LKESTGFDSFSVDQTDFFESRLEKSDTCHALVKRFPSDRPVALINCHTDQPWRARPAFYDLSM
jgi:hypothetical protein